MARNASAEGKVPIHLVDPFLGKQLIGHFRIVPTKRLDDLSDATLAQVERWGPRSTDFGEPFNVQPDGHSALWFLFRTLDPDADYKIYIDSQPILTTIAADRNLITAALAPKHSRQLVSTHGRIPIHLVDTFQGKQLIGHFRVVQSKGLD